MTTEVLRERAYFFHSFAEHASKNPNDFPSRTASVIFAAGVIDDLIEKLGKLGGSS